MSAYAERGLLEVMYLIRSLYLVLDISQFNHCKIGDRYGTVIGRCHCAYIYIGIICLSFEYNMDCITCAERDLDVGILEKIRNIFITEL